MTARKPQQILPIIALSLVALTSCSKNETTLEPTATPKPETTGSALAQTTPAAKSESSDGAKACALLTSAEIEAVQGEPLKVTHPTGKTGGGLAISQCYFELPTPANSVVVTLTEKAEGAGSRDPKQSWEEMFHRSAEIEKRSEEKEERAAPNKIEGVGDEAFWTGSRIGGALYILKGNSYIRISVGGAGDQAAKIEKSKTLAESILKRISQ